MGELEEGEIVEDDDFEAISSDNSIPTSSGKSVTSNGSLRALSLSSVSSFEADLPKRKHEKCHHRRKKRRRNSSGNHSSDTYNDLHYLQNLKDKFKKAIRISDMENAEKRNSLQSRLRAMGNWCNEGEADSTGSDNSRMTSKNDKNVIVNSPSPEKFDDSELEALRLEALRTAVLNKCMIRKKRKLEQEQQRYDNKENNKEPIVEEKDIIENENKKLCLDQNVSDASNEVSNNVNRNNSVDNNKRIVQDLDEDEDVLRASLLAAISKNMTKKSIEIKTPQQQQIQKTRNVISSSFSTKKINNNSFPNSRVINNVVNKNNLQQIQQLKMSSVKPLIISLNDTSDSEEEQIETNQQEIDLNKISTTVDKFLKEQRAKVELIEKQQLQMKNHQKPDILQKSIGNLEKSVVKLLPKSQQIEYQELLIKLKAAEKKHRSKTLLRKEILNKTENPENQNKEKEELIKPIIHINNLPNIGSEICTTPDSNTLTTITNTINLKKDTETDNLKKSSTVNDLIILQKILKDIKVQKNGRLQNQLKNEYQVLTPIIKKINITSIQRRKHETRIKLLEKEVNETKQKLSKCYEEISPLIKELIMKKEVIDKRLTKQIKKDSNVQTCNKHVKINIKHNEEPVVNNSVNKEDSKIKNIVTSVSVSDKNSTVLLFENQVNPSKDLDIHIDVADPNDIDKIYNVGNIKSHIPEYISPLTGCDRYINVDPLAIMCPYEVNGSCRDVDCTFKHYLKLS